MGQLQPVVSSALYAYNLVNRPTVHTRETLSGQAGMFSAAIWRQLMHVVELKENMRAKEDPQFVALLARMLVGQAITQSSTGTSNYDTLKTRIMDRLAIEKPDEYKLLYNAPIVFGERRLQDRFNDVRTRKFATDSAQEFHSYLSIDKVGGCPMTGSDRLRLSTVQSKESKELLGQLPLIPGMPVIVTENLSMPHKVVNGSEGVLRDVIYRNVPEGREAVCAYVQMPVSSLQVNGLERSLMPIFPQSTQFTYNTSSRSKIQISCSQLPLIPGWAFTDYKVQGTSLESVIVDLYSVRGLQNAYVMLSRVKAFVV
jgi:hypothetical protein